MKQQTLGRYRLLEEIGAGGMGVVYRARDERLGREVAVKILPPGTIADASARKRFRQEAMLVSLLNHPNIETVYDFDTENDVDFLVMEYIAGESLDARLRRGVLPEKEVLRFGAQLARGLTAAHEKGLLHRDLKPANLRITADGQLKILDFGLAKLLRMGRDETAFSTTVEMLTKEGTVVGTLPYMAPEQLRGEALDARADLYGAGVVLYEFSTGQRPFAGETQALLTDAILNRLPEPPRRVNRKVSPGLENVILKALEKDPDLRYQMAAEMAVDLERLSVYRAVQPARVTKSISFRGGDLVVGGVVVLILIAILNPGDFRERWFGARTGMIQAIAVLPLVNRSGNPEEEYFVEGITDELTANLAQISALKVISRTSASTYKGTKKRAPEIAKELGVDAIVEGAVQRLANKLRITVGLIDAKQDRQLWADTYEREETDVLALQDDVVRAIAEQIHAKLTTREKSLLESARPVDPQAYQTYLRGRQALNRYTQEGFIQARAFFNQALEIDPQYGAAYAGIADSYYGLSNIWSAPNDVLPLSRAAASKALELDPELAEGHASLGMLKAVFDWDWTGAEEEFKHAIALNPNLSYAHYGFGYVLSAVGRADQALEEYSVALELDPLSVVVGAQFGYAHLWARRYADGIKRLEKVIAIDPNNYYARPFLGLLYAAAGQPARAVEELELGMQLGENPQGLAQLAYVHGVAGNKKKALDVLNKLDDLRSREYVPSYDLAVAYVGLGDKETAFRWLENAFLEKSESLIYLKVDPRLDPIRLDPRYATMVRRLGL